MLLGANIEGSRPNATAPMQEEGATPLFIGISTMLFIAVNIRMLGTIWAVFMVLLCLAILYMGRSGIIMRFLRQPVLVLLPCIFALSCLWSDVFKVSLSLGLQTLLTVVTAVTVAQCTTIRQFLFIVFLSTSIASIGCILHGGQGPSAHGPVLIGFLGSKDAMGLFAYLGVMTCIALMFDRENSSTLRRFALGICFIQLYIATTVHASAAIVALALGITIFFATYFVLARWVLARWAFYFVIILAGLTIWLAGNELMELFFEFTSKHLGKDSTLTGRTLLWDKALALFLDSPILGHGYRAYWVSDDLSARRLLFMMGSPDGRGFNFHQQYLEVMADTGSLGLSALLITFAIFTYHIWKSVGTMPNYFSAYAFTILVVYLIRWKLESSFLPFSFDMMMFYGLATLAMKRTAFQGESKPMIGDAKAQVSVHKSNRPSPSLSSVRNWQIGAFKRDKFDR